MERIGIPYLGTAEVFEGLRTENPIEAMWGELNMSADPTYLKKIRPAMSGELASYICMTIRQAYEYYLASIHVSYMTKPLLIYYSHLNLAKAAIAFKNNCTPPPHHGLTSYREGIDMKCCTATICKGVFSELGDLTKSNVAEGDVIQADEFCKRIIELLNDYYRYFGKIPVMIPCNITRYAGGTISLMIDKKRLEESPNLETILTKKLHSHFAKECYNEAGSLVLKNTFPVPKTEEGMDKYGDLILNQYFCYSTLHDNRYYLDISERHLSQECCYFGLMFILGSVVRYSPILLYKWIYDFDMSNKAFIEKICSISSRVFPNLMLNLMYGRKLKYSPSFI